MHNINININIILTSISVAVAKTLMMIYKVCEKGKFLCFGYRQRCMLDSCSWARVQQCRACLSLSMPRAPARPHQPPYFNARTNQLPGWERTECAHAALVRQAVPTDTPFAAMATVATVPRKSANLPHPDPDHSALTCA